jgi:hypothetical protein
MDTQPFSNISNTSASQYADKLEYVFRAYEKSLDLDIALALVPLSAAERDRLIEDSELRARIALYDAKVCEELVDGLRCLVKGAASEGVRLAAIRELGRTFYPKRFKHDAIINLALPEVVIKGPDESDDGN